MGSTIWREARAEDIPALLTLLDRTKLRWPAIDTIEAYEKKLDHDPLSIIVLEKRNDNGRELVGMVMTVFDPWVSIVYHLAVDPAHQRQGHGATLMDMATRNLRFRGAQYICGYIMEENTASRALFEKLGFHEIPGVVAAAKKT